MGKTPDFNQNKDFSDFLKKKNHPLPETGWNNVGPSEPHGIDFAGSWGNVGGTGSPPASWYLSENGEVRLRGRLTGGSSGDVIFTLPEEVRPEFTERYVIPIEDFVHLEGIHFRAFSDGTGLAPGEDVPPVVESIVVVGRESGGSPTARLLYTPDEFNTFELEIDPDFSGNFSIGVCYGAGKYVATTDSEGVAVSSDGITWVNHSAGLDSQTNDVCYSPELGLYLLAGSNLANTEVIETSSDGSTWTPQTTPFDDNYVQGVAWSPDLHQFVALGIGGFFDFILMTSPDGITWTAQTTPFDGGTGYNAAWSPTLGLWVAVGTSDNGIVMTSPDGITWTSRLSNPGFNKTASDVVWSPDLGLFVVAALDNHCLDGTHTIAISSNGTSWTLETAPFSMKSAGVSGLTWSSHYGSFFAACNNAGVYSSTDGVTWSSVGSLGFNSSDIACLA